MLAPDKIGRVFDLEQPRLAGMPIHPAHLPGYSYLLHRRHEDEYEPESETGPRSGASGIIVCMEHSGTHMDALCHQSDGLTLFSGVKVNSEVQTTRGFKRLAVDEVPPLLAPSVLLDVPAKDGVQELEPGYAVSKEDLQECCEEQDVNVKSGSVVLVRTGNARYWNDTDRYLAGPGMAVSASNWLAERQVLAVGADNMAWDVAGLYDRDLGCTLPGHLLLLARHGIYIIENLLLEELAEAAVRSSFFVCVPLKFVGATGSPVRPLAIVQAQAH